MRKSILLLATVTILVAGISVPTLASAQTYDLNADWSDVSNPNGVWTYLAGSTVMAYDSAGANASGQPGWVGPGGYLPVWFKYTGADYFDIHTGDVFVHSANDDSDGIANILWTAPSTGTIGVSGASWFGAEDCCQGGRSSVWSLWLNGNLLTSGEVASGDAYDRSSPFLFSLGSGGAVVLQNISVSVGDQLMLQVRKESGPYGTFVGINWTVALTAGGPVCPNASFAADAIIWHQPLARNGASEDTDPSADRTVKYRFKRGSTIPIQIHALGCTADVTSNANVIGSVAVFGDSNCGGANDANSVPIDFNGVGGGGGVMEKVGGHLKYNLDTKTLPTTTQCYILRVTVADTSTGEGVFEDVLLQAK